MQLSVFPIRQNVEDAGGFNSACEDNRRPTDTVLCLKLDVQRKPDAFGDQTSKHPRRSFTTDRSDERQGLAFTVFDHRPNQVLAALDIANERVELRVVEFCALESPEILPAISRAWWR